MGRISVSSFIPHDAVGLAVYTNSSHTLLNLWETSDTSYTHRHCHQNILLSQPPLHRTHQFATANIFADATTFQQARKWCDHYTRCYTTGVLNNQTTWGHKMTSMTLRMDGWAPISLPGFGTSLYDGMFFFPSDPLLYLCIYGDVMGGYLFQG
jgi:hypothetical protein